MSQVLEDDSRRRFVLDGVEWVAQYAPDGELYKTYPTDIPIETSVLANQQDTKEEVLFDLTDRILED